MRSNFFSIGLELNFIIYNYAVTTIRRLKICRVFRPIIKILLEFFVRNAFDTVENWFRGVRFA